MMNLPIGDIVFWGFASLTVASGMVVAFSKKITHAAFALLFALFGVAGLFVFLGADFLAGVQVLVYVGGILVLLLFGILMTQTIARIQIVRGTQQRWLGGLAALAFLAVLLVVVQRTGWQVSGTSEPVSTTEVIGTLLMTDFVLPFEIASILLLAALIGAVKMARKEES